MSFVVESKSAWCKTFHHFRTKEAVEESKITNAFIRGETELLKSIVSIDCADLHIDIDRDSWLLRYDGMHADPIVYYEEKGSDCIEFTLYNVSVGKHKFKVTFQDESESYFDIEITELNEVQASFTSFFIEEDGLHYIAWESSYPIGLIVQQTRFGKYVEEKASMPAGVGRHLISGSFSDYIGICLNVSCNGVDTEHKHVVLGSLSSASARDLIAGGAENILYGYGSRYKYKSAICHLDSLESLQWCINSVKKYNEVDFVSKDMALLNMAEEKSSKIAFTKKTLLHEDEYKHSLLLEGSDSGEVIKSHFLFKDSSSKSFYGLIRCENLQAEITQFWLASDGPEKNDRLPHYGVDFSYPHKKNQEFKKLYLRTTMRNLMTDHAVNFATGTLEEIFTRFGIIER